MGNTCDGQGAIHEPAAPRPNTKPVFEPKDAASGSPSFAMTGNPGAGLVAHIRGRGDVPMTTDAIMALTRHACIVKG